MVSSLTTPDLELRKAVYAILGALGLDQSDENLKETPRRVATWLQEFAVDEETSAADILQPRFPEEYKELVLVKDINFVALCAHHMLPFRGVAHVGYIPQGEVVGISKLARLVNFFAHRLTLQERITQQVVDALMVELAPMGAMVVVEAEHQCMTIRGIKDPTAKTVTSAVRGVFLDNQKGSKDEFLRLIK